MKARELGFYGILGVIGGFIASLFGGWDASLITLLIFMAVDYITGLIVVGVFHRSEKTENGTLESHEGWKGLCRKGVTLLIVLVACRLDLILGSTFICDAVVIAFIVNETISLIENAGLMGVPSVKVKKGAKTYRGGSLASFVYDGVYVVMQVGSGVAPDYIVIGDGRQVTAAVRTEDLIKL